MKRAALTAVVVALLLAGCSDGDEPKEDNDTVQEPFRPAAVALDVGNEVAEVGDPIRIGVLGSNTSAPGEGDDYGNLDAGVPAAGAWVAAYRYGLAGREVEVVYRNDRGDADQAVAAIEELVREGVSGIVVTSVGSHLEAALTSASEAGVPVLLPYARPVSVPEHVYLTGPSRSQVDAAINAALDSAGAVAPVMVTTDGAPLVALDDASFVEYDASQPGVFVDEVRELEERRGADALVVSSSAEEQGGVVALIQGRLANLPVILTPEALTPAFTRALVEQRGTTSGALQTVGVDASDTTTLTTSPAGDAAAAFFSAHRLAMGEPGLGDAELGDFADWGSFADVASHDAVVALVTAVREAESAGPEDVASALNGLTVTAADGLAGSQLEFIDSDALPDEAIGSLFATTQDPGVRLVSPDVTQRPLFWFVAPADE
ncbi:ABC transporter substrate-binding protein [Nocardioides humilatus]|uniref:ABC transporter substrate-binding protein n=1 Tax=Nocardioides humilatus TaxID=2607660 RepID=A0A5B1LPZ8_9ACTN|nr:ABC transporter substrate-binding protein [Nocardioides humilatus]KAA1421749.1 ABC transporter substrate-binding protein [Nocardioides humilatus]